MRIISFSLYGGDPLYCVGACKNAVLARLLFPGWVCVYTCDQAVPVEVKTFLRSLPNVIILEKDIQLQKGSSIGMFWRYEVLDKFEYDFCVFRDTDSRLSMREVYCINDWIKSQAKIHIIRDHPHHNTFMLGGMWGIKKNVIKNIAVAISKFMPSSEKGQDQLFLTTLFSDKVSKEPKTALLHDPFFAKSPFPKQCNRGAQNGGVDFIGQVFDDKDRAVSSEDINILYRELTE